MRTFWPDFASLLEQVCGMRHQAAWLWPYLCSQAEAIVSFTAYCSTRFCALVYSSRYDRRIYSRHPYWNRHLRSTLVRLLSSFERHSHCCLLESYPRIGAPSAAATFQAKFQHATDSTSCSYWWALTSYFPCWSNCCCGGPALTQSSTSAFTVARPHWSQFGSRPRGCFSSHRQW